MEALRESHILIHAFLISQNLPKTANALVKELSRADPALEYDVVEESGSKSGAEIMGMVRARLELEKNSLKKKGVAIAIPSVESDSSSDSSDDSDSSSSSSDSEPAIKVASSSASSSSSSSSSDSDSEPEAVVVKPKKSSKIVAAATPVVVLSSDSSDTSDSSDSSDSDSSDSSSSEDEAVPTTIISTKRKAEDTSSDSSSASSTETSQQSLAPLPVTPLPKKQKLTVETTTLTTTVATLESPMFTPSASGYESPMFSGNDSNASFSGTGEGKKKRQPNNTPFRRVKAEDVTFADERLKDNSFQARPASMMDYGARASADLIVTRGKGFTKEKNKKKRGSYRGGDITMASHSIKFT